MIFCACQLQEKAGEQQKPLYLIFYDPEKAFDSVPRDAAWAIMKCFGLPDQIIAMLRALHDGMAARVIHQVDMSEEFLVTCGLKQGCFLAPTAFSFYLDAMLHDIPQDNPGVEIKYCTDLMEDSSVWIDYVHNAIRELSQWMNYSMQMTMLAHLTPMKKYSIQLTITLMHMQLMACLSIKIKQSL